MAHNIADHFETVATEVDDQIAIDSYNGSITYAELDARANRFAHWLVASGIEPGDRVGLALYNHAVHIEALLGAFKAGAVPINVNYRYTAEELAGLLNDAEVRIVVHERELSEVISLASRNRDWTRLSTGDDYERAVAGRSPDPLAIPRSGDDHYILYTGGTTGQPKGVVWRHEDLINGALAGLENIQRGSRMLPACPLIHGTAQWTTLATLLGGATVVLGNPQGLDPEDLWSIVEAKHVTRLTIVGDAFARPLLACLDAEPTRWDLSNLLVISSGGARWSPTVRDALLLHLPHTAMVNGYGASESGGVGAEVTFAGQHRPEGLGLLQISADETTSVLGPDNLPVAPGSNIIGRIARRGPVPLGYLGDGPRSSETFPTINGERWAIPGDLARHEADGTILLLGRDRNVINTGGEKVFAENVEQVLVSHPAVADAVAGSVPDPRWGERLVALVSLQGDATISTDALIKYCRDHLAGFKVPRRITICPEIRRHHTGKLNRTWAADTMVRSEK